MAAETESIRAKITAERRKAEQIIAAETKREVAQVELKSAKADAEALLTEAEASRKVVEAETKAEADVLRDRNVELCNALAAAGKRVDMVMCRGVGHAFQVLNNSPFSQARTQEMLSHIKSFISQS